HTASPFPLAWTAPYAGCRTCVIVASTRFRSSTMLASTKSANWHCSFSGRSCKDRRRAWQQAEQRARLAQHGVPAAAFAILHYPVSIAIHGRPALEIQGAKHDHAGHAEAYREMRGTRVVADQQP